MYKERSRKELKPDQKRQRAHNTPENIFDIIIRYKTHVENKPRPCVGWQKSREWLDRMDEWIGMVGGEKTGI